MRKSDGSKAFLTFHKVEMSVSNTYNPPQMLHKLYKPRKSELCTDDRASAISNGDTSHMDFGALETIFDTCCEAFSIKTMRRNDVMRG